MTERSLDYTFKIGWHCIESAISWCKENCDKDCWDSYLNNFYFADHDQAMAFKLSFNTLNTLTMIDPPEGWKYGFPKTFDIKYNQNIKQWLLENGYPQHLIDQGMAKHCRFWEKQPHDQ